MMKTMIVTLSALSFILLSACATEEGAKKHEEKGKQPNAMMMDKQAAQKSDQKSAATEGGWEAMVYKKPGAKPHVLGRYASRDECAKMSKAHIAEASLKKAYFACSR